MPLLGTRAAASARGFGFGSGAGLPYWISYTTFSSNLYVTDVSVGPSNAVFTGGSQGSTTIYTYLMQANAATGTKSLSRIQYTGVDTGSNVSSVSSTGDIAVASGAPSSNYFTVSYLSSTGSLQWGYAAFQSGVTWNMSRVRIVGSSVYYSGSGNTSGIFIAKMNSSGSVWMKKTAYATTYMGGLRFAIDASENTYFAADGNYRLAKVDSSGNVAWSSNYTPYAQYGSCALDSSGSNLYRFARDNSGTNAVALMKIGTASGGNPSWTRTLTAPSGVNIYSASTQGFTDAATDSSGNVYGSCIAYDSRFRAYLFKYDSSGVIQWQRQVEVTGLDIYNAVLAVNSLGQIEFALSLYNTVYRELILQLPADGSKTGTYTVGAITVVYSASSFTTGSATVTATSGGITLSDYGLSFPSTSPSGAPLSVTTTAVKI